MVEFLSIGAHAVRRGAVQAGERVLVAGAGPIGVATSLFARLRGADVILIDTNPARLEHTRTRVGLAQTALVAEDLESELRERTTGDFFPNVTSKPRRRTTKPNRRPPRRDRVR